LFALIFLLTSCSEDKVKTDAERLAQNRQDTAELKRIQSVIISSKIILVSDYESLKNLRAKYPASVDVRQTFQAALILRNDWEALEKFLTEIPQEQRTKTGQIELTKVYIKQGKTAEAANVIEPMTVAAPNDAELNALAGQAFFFTGQYDKAASCLDRVWNDLISKKSVDEMTVRGLIYFYQGNNQRAVEVLEQALKIDPQSVPAANALSRVYSAQGDREKAETYRTQAEQLTKAKHEEEKRQSALVKYGYELEDAWKAKSYDAVIRIAQEMMAFADNNTKIVLYQYQAQAYQALGKTAEAQSALNEAAKLQTNKTQ